MKRIQRLDGQVANQIAAGEVVERPASVVKECVENSLDANATQISIDIMQGGHELIRVRDNGTGIHPDDLSLALSRHATSKVTHFKDLEAISSLGFRGEALASIAAVSRLKLTTAIAGGDAGCCLSSDAQSEPPIPAAHPIGTTVDIRDLFYNTPARRKFLRAPRTEYLHIQTVVNRLALSCFEVGFTLKHNDRQLFHSAAAHDEVVRQQRVAAVMGQEFLQEALCIEFEAAGVTLTGYIALPVYSRSQADMQYFYINGRFVRDKLLSHAVKHAYHEVLFHGRHPAYVLFLQLNPALVDVNVHPTKHEVRFREGRSVHDMVVRGVRDALQAVRPRSDQNEISHEVVSGMGAQAGATVIVPLRTMDRVTPHQQKMALTAAVAACQESKVLPEVAGVVHDQTVVDSGHRENTLGVAIAQLHDIYILAQNEQGLVIVDMHAAHERILYEAMKKDFEQQQIAVQSLLVPVVVTVTPHEMDAWEQNQSLFTSVGLDVSAMGPTSLSLRGVPAQLKDAEGKDLVHAILADLMAHGRSQRAQEKLDSILGNMACHQAIKAHQTLTREEMDALLRQMEHTVNSGYCNHGRPTWVQYSIKSWINYFYEGSRLSMKRDGLT